MATQPNTQADDPLQNKVDGSAAKAYELGTSERDAYLERARDISELTIPTLFRKEGASGADKVIVPWNSIGAYLVNNLGSKIVFALFPAGRPNFKAEQDKRTQQDLQQLDPEERAQIKAIIDQGLSSLEQEVATAIEEDGDRARMFVAALRMLIGGNHGLQQYADGTIRGIPLERFITRRDPQGNLIEFCIKDDLDWETIDEDVRVAIMANGTMPEPTSPGSNSLKPVSVYTHGVWRAGRWKVYQEAQGIRVDGSEATYTKDALPYLFLPWILLDGEHYGRSYCEFYQGDLQAAEGLTKTIGEGSAALARFLILVSPTGLTDKKMVAQADNGDVITGRADDVHVLTSQKSADFGIAQNTLNDALNRLGRAFLLNSTVQRGGERVTAEEIRYVAQELEDALGGVYSQQIITWQAPYVRLKLAALQRARRVTPLPKNTVKITVTAGLAALGRNQELSTLRQFAAILNELLGAQNALTLMKGPGFVSRLAAALGVDPTGLVKSEEEIAEEQAQAQQQQMIGALGPEALRQFGSNATARQVATINAEAKAAQQEVPGEAVPAPEEGQ